MKKYLLLLLVTCIGICSSCKYDDNELWDSVDDLANRVSALETLTQRMNGDISALQAVITAVENQVSISEVEKLTDGYILHFTNGTTATIKHGTDGKDGVNGTNGKDGVDGTDGKDGVDGTDGKDGVDGTDGKDGKDGKDAPSIYIAKENGVYYWTITVDGKTEWLTDEEGNKLPVSSGSAGTDGEDGKDGADGEDGKDGANGTNGVDGKPGRTPSLKIDDNGDWMVSYDGTTWTNVAGSANALSATTGPAGSKLFESVELSADKSVIVIKMAEGGVEYRIPVLQSLAFFLHENRTGETAKTKEMTWKKDSTEFVYYFTLNTKVYPKYQVMSEAFSDVQVDMENKKVTLTLPASASNPNPAGARAVILFYNNKQTLTAVFKFKNFLVPDDGGIDDVNHVLGMLKTTEETNLQMPDLTTGGTVVLPLVEGASTEGSGTNTTLQVGTITDAQPLVFQQIDNNTQTPGLAINNVTTSFTQDVDTVKYVGPKTSFYLDGGKKLTKVEALTAEGTLHVRDIEIVNLIVKGGNIRIYPSGKITGTITNDSGKKIKIFLEDGATLDAKELKPDSASFEIVQSNLVIKNKELSYALFKEFPNDVTLDKKGFAEMTRKFANSVSNLDFNFKNYTITSLAGIENFPNLTELHCSGTHLKECDLSKNTQLQYVSLLANELTSLDFSKNVNLLSVHCGLNKNLTTLNIKECTQLTSVRCGETALTSLEFHDITQIEALDFGYTKLSFDLNQFTSLKALGCYGHNFVALNLSSELKQRLVELQCYYCGITELNLAEYPNLVTLNAHFNYLTSLNLAAAPNLVDLNCHNNKIASLDITPLYGLNHLYCGEQHLNGPNEYGDMNLILTDAQKELWESLWGTDDYTNDLNDYVVFNDVKPTEPGTNASGSNFGNGGVF